MQALKLDISRLPTAENKLVQAYFRLYAHEQDFLWEIAEAPPFNAVMIDGEAADAATALDDTTPRIVLGSDSAGDCNLPRPLRSDVLMDLLRTLQSPVQPPAAQAVPISDTIAPSLPAEAAPTAHAIPGESFKLTAMPPVALLQRNPQRQLAASLLLRQAMSLQEIAEATRWPVSEAQTFVGLLRNTGLIETSDESPAAPKNDLANALTAEADNSLSLSQAISSFRRKLGI